LQHPFLVFKKGYSSASVGLFDSQVQASTTSWSQGHSSSMPPLLPASFLAMKD